MTATKAESLHQIPVARYPRLMFPMSRGQKFMTMKMSGRITDLVGGKGPESGLGLG